eukprot:GHVR01144866.1.p1 GENE.GHVR01144866.1~~GHVR01144866.1.p1  ORF type:complete len:245 (+),score=42.61 GHVR01144866.1:3-737(+)
MHDLNSALDGIREVMPYAQGPSVRKMSKIATLLLAKNYILMLQTSLSEMKTLVSDISKHPSPHGAATTHPAARGFYPTPGQPTGMDLRALGQSAAHLTPSPGAVCGGAPGVTVSGLDFSKMPTALHRPSIGRAPPPSPLQQTHHHHQQSGQSSPTPGSPPATAGGHPPTSSSVSPTPHSTAPPYSCAPPSSMLYSMAYGVRPGLVDSLAHYPHLAAYPGIRGMAFNDLTASRATLQHSVGRLTH